MAVRGVLTEARIPYDAGQEGAAISGLLQHLVDLAGQAGGPPPLPSHRTSVTSTDFARLAGNQQFRAVAEAAEQLRQDIKVVVGCWRAAARAGSRMGERSTDSSLTRPAWTAPTTSARSATRSRTSRLLLDRPRSGRAADQLSSRDLLRDGRRGRAVDELAAEYARQIARARGIGRVAAARARTIEQRSSAEVGLVAADRARRCRPTRNCSRRSTRTSLSAWNETASGSLAESRCARASSRRKKLEPKSVTVKPRPATLKTEADVDAYLDCVARASSMQHVDAGETVII